MPGADGGRCSAIGPLLCQLNRQRAGYAIQSADPRLCRASRVSITNRAGAPQSGRNLSSGSTRLRPPTVMPLSRWRLHFSCHVRTWYHLGQAARFPRRDVGDRHWTNGYSGGRWQRRAPEYVQSRELLLFVMVVVPVLTLTHCQILSDKLRNDTPFIPILPRFMGKQRVFLSHVLS